MALVYRDDPKFAKKLDEIIDTAVENVLDELVSMFGYLAVRNMSSWDLRSLRITVGAAISMGAREMEFHYIDQSFKDSQQASANMFRALVAGLELGEAGVEGREPDPGVLDNNEKEKA